MLAVFASTGCSREDNSKGAAGGTGSAVASPSEKPAAGASGAVLVTSAGPASAVAAAPAANAAGAPQANAAGSPQPNAAGSPQPNAAAAHEPNGAGATASTASGAPQPAVSGTGAQIYSIATSPNVVHAGEAVVWDVRTTPNIVTVTAHVSAYTIPLHRTAPGRFALNFTIPPNVPGIFHGVYSLDVTARTESGASASRTVSMSFQ